MPQGLLNILEPGEHLLQMNVTKKVASTETGIVRGSLIVIDSDEWRRTATATEAGGANDPGPVCYFALQDQVQPDVAMADGLTGIPVTQRMKLETDQIAAGGTFPVGGYVSAGDNGLLKDHLDDETSLGVVLMTTTTRWSNDRLADATQGGAQRTGAPTDVIQILTEYTPNLSVA